MADEAEQPAPGDILIAEFNYIAQTAFQANEDRARVASFYLVSFGSFLAALFSTQIDFSNPQLVNLGFSGLFLALAVMGYLTLLQLASLRGAWFRSIAAMNQIKEYYFARHPGLDAAFAWKKGDVPHKFKPNSMGYYMIVQVAFLGGISLGGAVYFAILAFWQSFNIWPGILVGAVSIILQMYWYKRQMK
jgi:hypothetical protein